MSAAPFRTPLSRFAFCAQCLALRNFRGFGASMADLVVRAVGAQDFAVVFCWGNEHLSRSAHHVGRLPREQMPGRIHRQGVRLMSHHLLHDLRVCAGHCEPRSASVPQAMEVNDLPRRRIKPEGAKIETPADLLPHVRHYADRKQEHFLCASINGANEILNIRVVSVGLIDRTPVHPREVFADALTDRASAIIVAHNHPSGGLEPSPHDIEVTAQLKEAGAVIGIGLLDHIIFNRSDYYSLLESGRL